MIGLAVAFECEKRRDGETGLICDRCESIWTYMLHATGWRPPRCSERAAQGTITLADVEKAK